VLRFRYEVQFRPDRLARARSPSDATAVGERFDEEESPAGLGFRGRALGVGRAVAAGVGHLDAQGAADDVERESEVPARDATVRGRVGSQRFGGGCARCQIAGFGWSYSPIFVSSEIVP
jgi:hypothetical protein